MKDFVENPPPVKHGPLRLLYKDERGVCHFERPSPNYDMAGWRWPRSCRGKDWCFVGGVPYGRHGRIELDEDMVRRLVESYDRLEAMRTAIRSATRELDRVIEASRRRHSSP